VKDDPIAALIRLLAKLPGIGEKSGARLAYHIWRAPQTYGAELAGAIEEVKQRVRPCEICGAPDVQNPCAVCADDGRDHTVIMVVEEPGDLNAVESAGVFKGTYHLLGGTLSPLAGKGPEDINLASLIERAGDEAVREVIIATNPSVEGDATAAHIEQQLSGIRDDLAVTRLGRGMPIGSEIKYLDGQSIGHAIDGRRKR